MSDASRGCRCMRLPALKASGFSRVMVTLILIGGAGFSADTPLAQITHAIRSPMPTSAGCRSEPRDRQGSRWCALSVRRAAAPGSSTAPRRELPFCNYFNEIGIYSMRSYRLDPETATEQRQNLPAGRPRRQRRGPALHRGLPAEVMDVPSVPGCADGHSARITSVCTAWILARQHANLAARLGRRTGPENAQPPEQRTN